MKDYAKISSPARDKRPRTILPALIVGASILGATYMHETLNRYEYKDHPKSPYYVSRTDTWTGDRVQFIINPWPAKEEDRVKWESLAALGPGGDLTNIMNAAFDRTDRLIKAKESVEDILGPRPNKDKEG